ncbi:MAG: hypothetical protein IJD13_06740 [Oscillospiraceae bacterium]|nr:hypothetical protein [Oscillospiraceae bacterium]
MEKILLSVEMHRCEEGGYVRFLPRKEGAVPDEYGCADAVNILYTINEMPQGADREAHLRVLSGLQKEHGLFSEDTHHPFHCTAHCLAALELLDGKRSCPSVTEEYGDIDVDKWLASLNWETCGGSGHIGAGVFSILYLTETMTDSWQEHFLDWLDRNADPVIGFGPVGAAAAEKAPLWLHMGDWFHFLFCIHAARRRLPQPEKLVDSCIELYRRELMPESFGRGQRFLDIDWAFTLNRAVLQSGYRFEESKAILLEFAEKYVAYLTASPLDEIQWQDMHLMFGAVCALAELQLALPGELYSKKALRQVLDRRPFI